MVQPVAFGRMWIGLERQDKNRWIIYIDILYIYIYIYIYIPKLVQQQTFSANLVWITLRAELGESNDITEIDSDTLIVSSLYLFASLQIFSNAPKSIHVDKVMKLWAHNHETLGSTPVMAGFCSNQINKLLARQWCFRLNH